MANFGQLILTNVGIQEQYKAQSGGQLKFKRIAMGSGKYSGNITALTKLVTENVSVPVSKGYVQNNAAMVEGFFSNESLKTGFAWREIGLYVEDANGKEVLYCYANAGDTYDYIPATTDERYSKYIRIATAIGNASNVAFLNSESFIYVDAQTFNDTVEDLQTEMNQLYPSKEEIGSAIAISDSASQPFVGLNIYGKSTQNGTPTPDNPVDIVSVENPTISVYGKNIMKPSGTKTANGVTLTLGDDGTYTISGTTTGYVNLNIGNAYIKAGHKYKPTIVVYSGSINPSYWNFAKEENMYKDGNGFLSSDVDTRMSIFLFNDKTGVTYNAKFAIMIELVGDDETGIYEPYKEEQTITFETPNGMPGIPVTSGGNYTDADGQQWVCDEVDFARGVYIQRTKQLILKSNSGWTKGADDQQTANTNLFYCYPESKAKGAANFMCDLLPIRNVLTSVNDFIGIYGSIATQLLYVRIEGQYTLDEFKSWVNDNPITVIYASNNVIETALTDEQIETYKALYTNNPNTTVMNDAGADMKVKYVTKTYDEILENVIFQRKVSDTFNVTIPTSWIEDTTNGGYKQTVSVEGIKPTDNPIVDVVLGSDVDANELYLNAWECISRITTAKGSITLYANDTAPDTAFNIQLKVVR